MERHEGLKHKEFSWKSHMMYLTDYVVWVYAVGSERQSGQTAEQSYLRSGTDHFFQKHMYKAGSIRALRPRLKDHKAPVCCCRVCVWECDDKQGYSISFSCHMMQIKRRLALNVPRLECLPLTRGTTGKNMLVVSGAAHTHTQTHTNTHPRPLFMVI